MVIIVDVEHLLSRKESTVYWSAETVQLTIPVQKTKNVSTQVLVMAFAFVLGAIQWMLLVSVEILMNAWKSKIGHSVDRMLTVLICQVHTSVCVLLVILEILGQDALEFLLNAMEQMDAQQTCSVSKDNANASHLMSLKVKHVNIHVTGTPVVSMPRVS